MNSRIMAGIVTYNPEIIRLKENIYNIHQQVDSILVVDNGSSNIDQIKRLICGMNKKIYLLCNNENKGIAQALNQIMIHACHNNYDWVLTLDQDSVCYPDLIDNYVSYLNLKNIGILTCLIKDRNFDESKIVAVDMSLSYTVVKKCITSGSFCSVDAYKKSDKFNNNLFIDFVDDDYCYNLREKGLSIYRINKYGLLHEVGHGKNIKLLWKPYISYNHNLFRQFYIARNHFYLAYRYPKETTFFHELLVEIRCWLVIFFFEDDSLNKILRRIKGIFDIKNLL